MATTWVNPDGLIQRFGTRDVENEEARLISSPGPWQTLVVDFDNDNLTTRVSGDGGRMFVPANSYIKESFIQAQTAWTGTGTITLGWVNSAGTAIDADGIDAAVDVDVALAAIGDVVPCDGAISTADDIGTSDAYVEITASGTVAGSARLIVTYLPPVSFDSF